MAAQTHMYVEFVPLMNKFFSRILAMVITAIINFMAMQKDMSYCCSLMKLIFSFRILGMVTTYMAAQFMAVQTQTCGR